jgi:transposase
MIVIGVDAHKRSHTLVAVDAIGRKLAERTVGTTSEDHLKIVEWAGQWPLARFAVEDCRHVTRRLERDLLTAGSAVVRVPTHLMAAARRGVVNLASPIRSTHWRWLTRRYESRICPWHGWMERPVR